MKKNNRPFSQDFSGPGKTQQHFTESADVNNIVAQFRATGIDPYAARLQQKTFGYASSQNFSDAMQNIAEINSAFAELPSAERQTHSNDPAVWLDHLAQTPTPEPLDDSIVAPTTSEELQSSENDPPEADSAGS